MTEGKKFDTNKPRWSLLPEGAVQEVIEVLEFGAAKYSENNWQKVPDARTRYYDAAMRHLDAWWGGQKADPETGKSHLAHAVCCLMFLQWLDSNQVKVPPDLQEQLARIKLAQGREFS